MRISEQSGDVMAEERRYYDPETRTFLPGARIHIEQYEILKRCSDRGGDISEWHQYWAEHPDEEIWLCGADLRGFVLKSPGYEEWRKDHEPREMSVAGRLKPEGAGVLLNFHEAHLDGAVLRLAHLGGAYLRGAYLDGADLKWAHLDAADLRGAHLDSAILQDAFLDGANLTEAHLDGADLQKAHLDGAKLLKAHLVGADIKKAHLDGTNLMDAHLEGADLDSAHMEGANLSMSHMEFAKLWWTHLDAALLFGAHLDGAYLHEAHLDGANLSVCEMRGTKMHMASVSGETVMNDCPIDRQTDTTGTPLDAARVEPGLRQLLEYNVRRLGWKAWYRQHRWLRLLVQPFWLISDYGRSTGWVICWFFILALVFGAIYWACALLGPPGIVANLIPEGFQDMPAWLIFIRAFYFSVVTMTTLGFGDIYAQPQSLTGHVCLMLQVILGYVLLGALVTRFAVLFTASGPAGRFSPRPKHDQSTSRQGAKARH